MGISTEHSNRELKQSIVEQGSNGGREEPKAQQRTEVLTRKRCAHVGGMRRIQSTSDYGVQDVLRNMQCKVLKQPHNAQRNGESDVDGYGSDALFQLLVAFFFFCQVVVVDLLLRGAFCEGVSVE